MAWAISSKSSVGVSQMPSIGVLVALSTPSVTMPTGLVKLIIQASGACRATSFAYSTMAGMVARAMAQPPDPDRLLADHAVIEGDLLVSGAALRCRRGGCSRSRSGLRSRSRPRCPRPDAHPGHPFDEGSDQGQPVAIDVVNPDLARWAARTERARGPGAACGRPLPR